MQPPTISGIRVRTTDDAHLIFHAVKSGIIHMVQRRLGHEERKTIKPGSCYVWEERGPQNDATGLGIERWTDGYRWGPSRVRDDFLFYHEKDPDPKELVSPKDNRRQTGYYTQVDDLDRMIKQTYSVYVCDVPASTLPGGSFRKWHLTAYFTRRTVDQLHTVNDFPDLAISYPPGLYKCARVGKHKKTGQQTSDSETVSSPLSGSSNAGPPFGTSSPMGGRMSVYSTNDMHAEREGTNFSHSYATSSQGYSHHRQRSDANEHNSLAYADPSSGRGSRSMIGDHNGYGPTADESILTRGSPLQAPYGSMYAQSTTQYDMSTPRHAVTTGSSPSERYQSPFPSTPVHSSLYPSPLSNSAISQPPHSSVPISYSSHPARLPPVSQMSMDESAGPLRLPPIHVLAANAAQDSWGFSPRTKEDDWAISRLMPGQTLGRKGAQQ